MTDYTVATYLLSRLKKAGVEHAFGVPGDYVLTFMDRMIEAGIEIVGTCNELNAGYAADAYARINGIGCVCVTWGVGGFSAMNAVAGAYAEQVPVVILVGSPRTTQRRSSMLLHHGVGNFTTMQKAFSYITAASVMLDDPGEAPHRIDAALARCLAEKRPIMIEIPADMVDSPCSPLGPFPKIDRRSDPAALSEALDEAMTLLAAAERPVILGGVELHRYGLTASFQKLVEASQIPFATTLLGKAVMSEYHKQAIGIYEGATSRHAVRDIVEKSDVLLCLGAWMSDINFGIFSSRLKDRHMILANSGRLKISHHVYEHVWIGDVVSGLASRMPRNGLSHPPFASVSQLVDSKFEPRPSQRMTVERLINWLNTLISEDTIVIADTGDALYSAADLVMHHDVGFLGQAFYLSIGYALPATLGVSLADPTKRIVTLIGDGAFQMTAQELSSLCRRKSNAVLLLLNNDGYTTERVIHEGPYNDIQPWEYHRLPEVFGGGWGAKVSTEAELDVALKRAIATHNGPALIEVVLDRLESSEALKRLGEELSPDKKRRRGT